MKSIVLGGGCFWCTEAVFKMLKGVESVLPGYAIGLGDGLSTEAAEKGEGVRPPTYEEVSTGSSGYAEVVKINYDPSLVSLENLLTVFFASHDPSSLNRQGNDVGTQYRSAIFYYEEEQRVSVEKFITEINSSSAEGRPIVTEVKPLQIFYPAESYHLDYYAHNKDALYCELVINPKLEKVQQKFAELLK